MIFLFIASALFINKRLLRYLQYLQQENYYNKRFFNWIIIKKAFDRKGSLVVFSAGILSFFAPTLSIFLASVALLYIFAREPNPKKSGKLTLKMTKRTNRIYFVSLAIYLISQIFVIVTKAPYFWLFQAILFQTIPLFLILANLLLQPLENYLQRKILTNAKKILHEKSPFVIGITGSYGKTSTKEILGNLLQVTLGSAFWPAKGINTLMGISRAIREDFYKGTDYAVIEMGAYKRGSIKGLCDFTMPRAAIITNVGTAHLERFKSAENIFEAKSELAKTACDILVCNGNNEGARKMAAENRKKKTILYGFGKNGDGLDFFISKYSFSNKGSSFTIHWGSSEYEGSTPLLGRTSLSNICAAFAMSCSLGCNPEYALAAIENLKPIGNRLQLEESGGMIFLHDAYNSNPAGFKDALDVMSSLSGKRRILITPGIIELGADQHTENLNVAKFASEVCDLVLFVGHTNKEAFLEGLPKEKILFFETRDEALDAFRSMSENGDIVLIENDLPDIYEDKRSF